MESSSRQPVAVDADAWSPGLGGGRGRGDDDQFEYTVVGAWPSDQEDSQEASDEDADDDQSYETAPDEAGTNADSDDQRRAGLFSSLQRSNRRKDKGKQREELKADDPCPPPFWSRQHRRDPSSASTVKVVPSGAHQGIRLEDHTQDKSSQTSGGLWARSVSIEDSVLVKGRTGVGAYTVWICRIQTLEGGVMTVRLRYSEFVELRARLYKAFPYARHSLPALPPKSALKKFNAKFLSKRREGLHYFLNCVLLNPEFSGAPVLKEFLFARI